MSEIYPNLFLGDVGASSNASFIKKSNITHILVAGKGLKQHFETKCTYMQLEIEDVSATKIITCFIDSIKFIDEAIASRKGVLVHCLGGVSRSATIVIAYIMIKEQKSFTEAYRFVQKRRPRINPNSGFITQLELFEKCLKYYFDNTKGDKIDYPFLTVCITPRIKELEKIMAEK